MQLLMNTGPIQPIPEEQRSKQQFALKHNHTEELFPEEIYLPPNQPGTYELDILQVH